MARPRPQIRAGRLNRAGLASAAAAASRTQDHHAARSVNRCSICRSREENERAILRSTICGHRICVVCLKQEKSAHDRSTELVNMGIVDSEPQGVGVVDDHSIRCSICKKLYPRPTWINLTQEQQAFGRLERYRKEVMNVMSSGRDRFPNTPTYDDYLESRELRIASIAEAPEEKRRELLDDLKKEKIQDQARILEDEGKREEKRRDDIEEIVEKEGIFFEVCRSNYKLGFRRKVGSDVKHPLMEKHPEYFPDVAASGKSKSSSAAAIIPMPLDPSITTWPPNIPRKTPEPTHAMKRAGGLSDAAIKRKSIQEFMGSLKHARYIATS